MAKRAYKASGLSEPGAINLLAVKALAAGVLAGAIEAFIGQWFSLFALFPLLIGGVVGAVSGAHVTAQRIRAPAIALLLAFLGGAAGQATVHVGEYLLFQRTVTQELQQQATDEGTALDDTAAAAQVDAFLEERTGHTGLIGFLHFDAETGTEVKKLGQSKGLEFSGIGSWLLWLAELLLAAGMAGWMAYGEARKPFCEGCKHWYDAQTQLAVGSGEKADTKAVVAALDAEQFGELPRLLGVRTEKAMSTLTLSGCSTCADHERELTFTRHTGLDAKPNADVRYQTMLTGDAYRTLVAAIERAKPADAVVDPA